MFTLLRDEITFGVAESFCKEIPEGVRVEYKQEITHIPKIVSSFANTLGGIFIIGVEADKETNMAIFPIKGIPKASGIEEQIQRSASDGIYPAVMPDAKIVDIPNTNNVVVVVRVDESVQAPHAIQNSTKIYVREGSTTPPYEFADVDRIVYMLKRREDSQVVARQVMARMEERIQALYATEEPTLMVIAKPVFPYRPVISTSDIYTLGEAYGSPPRRVAGGVSYFRKDDVSVYREFNEYGIVCYRTELFEDEVEQAIEYGRFLSPIQYLIEDAEKLYTKCEYLGNIEVTAKLRHVFGKKLHDTTRTVHGRSKRITEGLRAEPECFDSTVSTSTRCLLSDFQDTEKLTDIVEELVLPLLWAFNIPTNDPWKREQIRKRIKSE
ncbi:MAG: ATP-binding protein [Candidatus Poribacteria bacterium]|nr:ATP-binding protein [Candidatus Poribacteria bacterium]